MAAKVAGQKITRALGRWIGDYILVGKDKVRSLVLLRPGT